ncbi:DNA modification methylase [Microbacterium terricola]|uniref:DNA modification methylase n=1 Tax=Microbacterium terricola TaxID=344163 RepID=A0ABM8E0L4_9MICO|nr:DNA modification methylase [Microbacterium terricola]UYK40924.1 DNA modification methylase [Microbacterium terricola]BDV31326.1 hypothetical protein Microterr_19860 [Microbacterium terricola]
MNSRFIASLALSAAVLAGTTGCSFMSTQATTIPYSASDGVNVPNSSGPVQVRNALIVTDETGAQGNFVAALVNDTDQAQTVTLDSEDPSITETILVPARTTLSLGGEDEPLLLEGIDTPAGSDITMLVQSGDGEGALVSVPVLDGTLPQYSALAP